MKSTKQLIFISPCLPGTCTKSEEYLKIIETRANVILREKYKTDEEFMSKKAINETIFNFKSHYSSLYKEVLLSEEVTEIVKRYYPRENIHFRLPRLLEYYAQNTQVFPMMSHMWESKYLQDNIRWKQRLIDDFGGRDGREQSLLNGERNYFLNKSGSDLFFTEEVNQSLMKEEPNLKYYPVNKEDDKEEISHQFIYNLRDKDDSDQSVEHLIFKIDLYDKNVNNSINNFSSNPQVKSSLFSSNSLFNLEPIPFIRSRNKKKSTIKRKSHFTVTKDSLEILANNTLINSKSKSLSKSKDKAEISLNTNDDITKKELYNKLTLSPKRERKFVSLKNKFVLRNESTLYLPNMNVNNNQEEKRNIVPQNNHDEEVKNKTAPYIPEIKFKKTEEFIQNEKKRHENTMKRSKVIQEVITKLKDTNYLSENRDYRENQKFNLESYRSGKSKKMSIKRTDTLNSNNSGLESGQFTRRTNSIEKDSVCHTHRILRAKNYSSSNALNNFNTLSNSNSTTFTTPILIKSQEKYNKVPTQQRNPSSYKSSKFKDNLSNKKSRNIPENNLPNFISKSKVSIFIPTIEHKTKADLGTNSGNKNTHENKTKILPSIYYSNKKSIHPFNTVSTSEYSSPLQSKKLKINQSSVKKFKKIKTDLNVKFNNISKKTVI